MEYFKGKVVWITGASSGIGKGLVELISKCDTKIVLSAPNFQELEKVVNNNKMNEDSYFILPFDLKDFSNAEKLIDAVVEKFGKIDILVNFGGISQRAFCYETSEIIERNIMEINYFGTVKISKAVLNQMIKQNHGQIAATSSLVGKFGFPLRSSYAASKHALHGYFESMALETKQFNINISMLIPGRILTDISKNAITKEGVAHGVLDDGQANGLSVEKAAIIIAKGLSKKKKEILVGKNELLMIYIKRFFPKLHFYLSGRIKAT